MRRSGLCDLTLDHCLAAAYDESTTHFREVAARAMECDGLWQERLHAAAAATVEAFDEQPDLARYCVVEAYRCNLPMLRASRLAGRRRYIEMLTDHRRSGGDEDLTEVRMRCSWAPATTCRARSSSGATRARCRHGSTG